MKSFPIVPLCEKQLRDIRPEDVLFNGLARRCDTYRGGGGYDQFNTIYEKRFGVSINPVQFVVQLRGCPFSCPYCYVTEDGVWGKATLVSPDVLIRMYKESGLDVLHLMGGAPALHLDLWEDVASVAKVFHSDFLLVESDYRKDQLLGLPGLHAVSFKEFTPESPRVKRNLFALMDCGVNFYVTFTGNPEPWKSRLQAMCGEGILEDSFSIEIKNYEALLEEPCQN